jgi:subtilisin family serine protease
VATKAFVNVFVETQQSDLGADNPTKAVEAALRRIAARLKDSETSKLGTAVLSRRNFVSATVPIASLEEVASTPGVSFVHGCEAITFSFPEADTPKVTAPKARSVKVDGKRQDGDGVIIGIIDVGGFDYAHPDFLDANGRTRFVSIWDQGGDSRAPPQPFGYGSEISQARMNKAIELGKQHNLPPTDIERQSQSSPGSHATHVTGIAAGNRGVCPAAEIAAVLVSIPIPDGDREARRWTFADSSRIVHAIEYLLKLAEASNKPISINISLGTNGGPHDGSNGPCRWIDAALNHPGRAICVAAGNAGQQKGETTDDLGWVMGRIHTSGRVPSRGLDVDLDWVVVGDGYADVSENELEIWYGAQDRMTVSIQPPGSTEWYTVAPRQFMENQPLKNGTYLSVYNELYHPTNGDNYIAVYLSPNLEPDSFAPIASGTWKVRLHGDEIRDGSFHAWIERDDPQEVGRRRSYAAYRCPSVFSERTNVDSHSIGSLGCAHRVVTVANADDRSGVINITSSQGPTRDNRNKPEIAAPGTRIVAACGFDSERKWTSMTGTSMASPYVCGVIGLMLSARRGLYAAQCLGILRRTARPLPSHNYEWRNDAGYGVLNPVEAIREAMAFDTRTERTAR